MAKSKKLYSTFKKYVRLEANEIVPTYSISSQYRYPITANKSNLIEEYIRLIWPEDLELRERCFLIFLTNQLRIKGFAEVSSGGLTSSVVPVSIILSLALTTGTPRIIVVHNHPSGEIHPSEADKALTRQLSVAAGFMNINLVDHMIITADGYYSFADNGLMFSEKEIVNGIKKFYQNM